MEKHKISTEYIKLDQFLKFVGAVGQGSDAKALIQDGLVVVNDEIELRRGKKLRPGDIVDFNGIQYEVE